MSEKGSRSDEKLSSRTDWKPSDILKLVKICYPQSDITYISDRDMHNAPETKIRGITFEVLK